MEKEEAMKRVLVLLMVTLLGLTVLVAAGCGGDTAQAQEYLKAADEAYTEAQAQGEEILNILTPMLAGAMAGNYAAVTPEVLANGSELIQESLDTLLPDAAAAYAKVNDLEGVEDYQAYADAMLKTIESDTEALAGTKGLIDSLAPIAQSGDAAQVEQWFRTNSAVIMQLQELQTVSEENYVKAQKVKSEKNLEF